ncbi:MAG: cellulase family glycosylhydrolase [Gemmataceae bacterium]
MLTRTFTLLPLAFLLAAPLQAQAPARWTAERANQWYAEQPWLVGCNFIPSTAVNQLEMWQADTFDPRTIDRELGWAAYLGMNTVRVFLHDLAWQADRDGFLRRVDIFLVIAARHRIRPALVLFDDCWNDNPRLGPQPAPIPGVHNSGWVQSPSVKVVNEPREWPRLERYVKDVVATFGNDPRLLFWDLYNEPGNSGHGEKSLPLLQAVFGWARSADPRQPLSVGTWFDNKGLNDYQLAASDIITFHNYNDAANLEKEIQSLRKLGRPVICTEYMARTNKSAFATCLPVFKKERVGCYNWGLVSGKTNTIFPWGSKKESPEPKVWFHDIFRADGAPFAAEEVALIRNLTGADLPPLLECPPDYGRLPFRRLRLRRMRW